MDKITYLSELAEGLARWVPDRERQNILCYYAEYFEEAGPDREAEAIAELGDPWALSSRLAVESGYVTAEQAAAWTPPKKNRWPWVVVGVAAAVIMAVSVVSFLFMAIGSVGRVSAYVRNETATPGRLEPLGTPAPNQIVDFGSTTAGEGAGSWSTVPFDAIDADISLGGVTVTTGGEYVLYVEQADLGGYSVKWEVKDGKLKIRDNGKSGAQGWDGLKALGGGAVTVTVIVPEGAALDKFIVKTKVGNVSMWDISAKKLEVETGMGNVECYEPYQVRELSLKSGMGDVTLAADVLEQNADLELESGMGDVEVTLGCAEHECEYELETGMGSVIVNGDSRGRKVERKGSAVCKLEAESGMGDVSVFFSG